MKVQRKRWRHVLIGLAIVAVELASFELGLRYVLFSNGPNSWRMQRALRRPELYADQQRSDLFWELQARFSGHDAQRSAQSDPELGWRSGRIGADYDHAERALLFDKRPVLLFGDSYAECTTPPTECFQCLLSNSGLGRRFHLLNYGIGGYGLDQVLLLLRHALPLYVEQDPIVLVGILIDDDLDRCSLSFRGRPKPYFELADDGQLALRGTPVPEPEQYHAPWRGPLLAHLFVHSCLPRVVTSKLEGRGRRDRATAALGSRIVEALVDELAARKVDSLFLLFRTEKSTRSLSTTDWRDRAVRDVLDRRGVAYLDLGSALREHASAAGEQLSSYFNGAAGHYNATGNRVAFDAIVEALRARFGLELERPPLSPAAIVDKVLPGAQSSAQYEFGLKYPFGREAFERVCLQVGSGGATEIAYQLDGHESLFSAKASLVHRQYAYTGSVGLTILGDGRELARCTVRRGDAPTPLAIDVRGVQRMQIRADDAGDGNQGDALVLALPYFQ